MKTATTKTTTKQEPKSEKYFGGWPGAEHIPYTGDYHTDGKKHQPLEKVAEEVAESQRKGSNKSS